MSMWNSKTHLAGIKFRHIAHTAWYLQIENRARNIYFIILLQCMSWVSVAVNPIAFPADCSPPPLTKPPHRNTWHVLKLMYAFDFNSLH